MSNLVSDDHVLVIDFDSNLVRIKLGITDVNVLPNVSFPCRLALPISESLTNGEGEGEGESSGGVVNFEDVSTYDLALIGDQLKNIDTTKYKLVNPLGSNRSKRIDEFKLFLYLIIVRLFKINLANNPSAMMLVLPPRFNKDQLELITQFCFEKLNTPGLYIIYRPMATLYGHGCVSGLVIDIGETVTLINPIMDNTLPEQSIVDINIGTRDLESHWLTLFQSDIDLKNLLGDKLNSNFVNYFKETVIPSLSESETVSEEDKNNPKEFEFEGVKFTIRDEIMDQIWDALFKSDLHSDRCLTLQHSIYNCLQKLDHDRRPLLTDNITFSGILSNVPGFAEKLEQNFRPFLSTSLNAGYTQINKLAFLKTPEYFSNFKGKRHLMTILGGMIAAKGTFNDYKNYVNKFDYNKLGPVSIHSKIN